MSKCLIYLIFLRVLSGAHPPLKIMKHKIKHLLMFCLISTLLLNSLTLPAAASYSKKTFYDRLSAEEINLLEVVIQHEVGGLSKEYKMLVAGIIRNRLSSEEFPDTVEDVLYQEGQFCGIDRWYSPQYEVDDETKEAVKEVFSKETANHEALYYYNPELSSWQAVAWFEYSGDVTFCFEYSEDSWGITYTTRFFK